MKKFVLEPAYVAELLRQAVKGTICEMLFLDFIKQLDMTEEIRALLNNLVEIKTAEMLMLDDISETKLFSSQMSIEAVKELLGKI